MFPIFVILPFETPGGIGMKPKIICTFLWMKERAEGNAQKGEQEFPFGARTCNNICADSSIGPDPSLHSQQRLCCVVEKWSFPRANRAALLTQHSLRNQEVSALAGGLEARTTGSESDVIGPRGGMLHCQCVSLPRSLSTDRRWQPSSSFSHCETQMEDFRSRMWWWWSPAQFCNYVQIAARASWPIRGWVIALSKPISKVMMCAERSQTAHLYSVVTLSETEWWMDGWSHMLQVKQCLGPDYNQYFQNWFSPLFSSALEMLHLTFKYLQSTHHPVTNASDTHAQSDALEWSPNTVSLHTNETVGNSRGTQQAGIRSSAFISSYHVYFCKLRSPNFAQQWDVCCGQSVLSAVRLMSLSLLLSLSLDPGDISHA